MAKGDKKEAVLGYKNIDWSLLKYNPAVDEGVIALRDENADLQKRIAECKLANWDDVKIANGLFVDVSRIIKTLEAMRTERVKPIKDKLIKPVEEYFRDLITPLQARAKEFERAIVTCRMKLKRDEAELNAILAETVKDSDSPNTLPIPQLEPTVTTTMKVEGGEGKSVAKAKWEFEVLDKNIIPEYVLRQVIQTTKGDEALRSTIRSLIASGVRDLAGVRIFEWEGLAAYTK